MRKFNIYDVYLRISPNFANIFIPLLIITLYAINIIMYLVLYCSQCSDVVEDVSFNVPLEIGVSEIDPLFICTSDYDLSHSPFIVSLSEDYDPFYELNFMDYSHMNKVNYDSNSGLTYETFNIGENRFIISNTSIFDSEIIQNLCNLSLDRTENIVDGNRVTTLIINTEVANLYFDSSNIPSANELYSGITEARQAADLQYENEVRAIRESSVVFSSPELSEFLRPGLSGGSVTILDVSPTNSMEHNITEDNLDILEELQTRMN